MIVILTEMYESASEVETMIIDTEKLPTKLKEIIENEPPSPYGGGYYVGASTELMGDGIDGPWDDAIIDYPYEGRIDRIVHFWWEG